MHKSLSKDLSGEEGYVAVMKTCQTTGSPSILALFLIKKLYYEDKSIDIIALQFFEKKIHGPLESWRI